MPPATADGGPGLGGPVLVGCGISLDQADGQQPAYSRGEFAFGKDSVVDSIGDGDDLAKRMRSRGPVVRDGRKDPGIGHQPSGGQGLVLVLLVTVAGKIHR
jgi:hypothetical protein